MNDDSKSLLSLSVLLSGASQQDLVGGYKHALQGKALNGTLPDGSRLASVPSSGEQRREKAVPANEVFLAHCAQDDR